MEDVEWSRAVIDQAFEFMGVLDLEGRLLIANRTALSFIKQPMATVQDQFFWETPWWAQDPRNGPILRNAIAQARQGHPFRQEVNNYNLKGDRLVVDFSLTPIRNEEGTILRLLAEGRDITEAVAQREALAQEESKFHLLFSRSQDGILLLDGDRFIECNPAVLRMMRCTEPEFMRMHPWDLSPPQQPDGMDSRVKALDMIERAMKEGVHRFEWVHRRKDGEDFPVEVTLLPIPLGGRTVLYTTWRDITHLRKNEQERMELERQLLHAQKLESLGLLAGGIAHDFNNLLTAILGYLNLAQELHIENPELADFLGGMEHSALKAAELTRQMLAYAGKGRFHVDLCDLNRVVRENRHLLAASVSKKIAFEMDLTEPLPFVEADAAQFQQVVMNLLTNAADAIGDREGVIRLCTRQESLDSAFIKKELPAWPIPPGPYLRLDVSDTGCGMAPEVVAKIFDPFYSTKGTGRGLGLSAIQGILRSHRAGLRVESCPDEGTTFSLYFPVSARTESELIPIQAPETPRMEGTVLLVDDEASIRETAGLALKSMGFEVLTASDGVECIELLKRFGGRIRLVILDLTMPHMGGQEVFAVIQAECPHLPVILSSGFSLQDPLEPQREPVPAGYLQKPYLLEDLRHVVSQALRT